MQQNLKQQMSSDERPVHLSMLPGPAWASEQQPLSGSLSEQQQQKA